MDLRPMKLPTNYERLTPAQRREAREDYERLQFYRCYHCDSSLLEDPPTHITSKRIDWSRFPSNFLKHPVHLHHNHQTGMTIGAVHAYCNAVLFQYHGE